MLVFVTMFYDRYQISNNKNKNELHDFFISLLFLGLKENIEIIMYFFLILSIQNA